MLCKDIQKKFLCMNYKYQQKDNNLKCKSQKYGNQGIFFKVMKLSFV